MSLWPEGHSVLPGAGTLGSAIVLYG